MSKSFAEDFKKDFEELILPENISESFDILELLAQNDYGETYLLKEKDGGKQFVLKCYKKTATIGVVHEAELLSGLEHKGLPSYRPEIENEDTLFILREYIDGITLEQYVEDYKINETNAICFATELCEILSFLHSQPAPIIHRDIKPSNIIINLRENRVTLIDFGISRKYSDDADTDTVFFGTRIFAPPEQYGFTQTDCRADIFALGIVLRYMLTGTTDKKIPLKNKSLERIVFKCTAFSPDKRYKNALALKNALKRYRWRVGQKMLYAAASLCTACLIFGSGFAVGRFTEFLSFQTVELTPDISEQVQDIDTAITKSEPIEDVIETREPMVFIEPLIEEAVRLTLNKKDSEPVFRDELKEISRIYIIGERVASSNEDWQALRSNFFSDNYSFGNIKNISDLTAMENLVEVHIMSQPLADISPISANPRLRDVEIMHCMVSDISSLISMPRLVSLELFDNLITDFSVFKEMRALNNLGIGNSKLKSIAELGDISNVEMLGLNRTQISNLDGLENFPNLKMLSIEGTNVRDFSPLDGFLRLESLVIGKDMEKYLNTLSRDDIEIIVR